MVGGALQLAPRIQQVQKSLMAFFRFVGDPQGQGFLVKRMLKSTTRRELLTKL
jgi:hypothetical protein